MNLDVNHRQLSGMRARQFLSRRGLTRPKLQSAGSPAWTTWHNLKQLGGIRLSTEIKELRRNLLLEPRHQLYQGFDGNATFSALEIQEMLLPHNSLDDFILNLYCEEILRDAGEPCDEAGLARILCRARSILEGWVVLRRWMEVAMALAATAHIHRTNAVIWAANKAYADAERGNARNFIRGALDVLQSHPSAPPHQLRPQVTVQLAFQAVRIAVEAGDLTMAKAALKQMKAAADNDPRTRLDVLRGEISVDLEEGNNIRAEDAIAEAYQIYEGLQERSPYGLFSLGYRQAKLWHQTRKRTAEEAVVERYFTEYNNFPNLFIFARMRNLWTGHLPVPVTKPEIYAARTSRFYHEDQLVRL